MVGSGSGCQPSVSYHAIYRYCQRILFVDIEGPFENNRDQATKHCAALGLSIEDVRDRILTPFVCVAVEMGFTKLRRGPMEIEIAQPERVITTIKKMPIPPRLKELSKREFHRTAAMKNRREKRKPSI